MAEEKPRSRTRKRSTAKAPTEESKAQAEFARYKARVEGASDETSVPSFATPLPRGAVPAWSLQPPMYATAGAEAGGGPADWGSPSPGAPGSQTVVEGAGQAIRLGVDLVNAALSRSVQMLNGLGDTVGMAAWGERSGCGCGSCCDCCDSCGYDCCYVMGCGCGRCEPSVGSCC
jgi:hypothetical protein